MPGRHGADAALFGHGEQTAEWFARVNLARDWLSLGKLEVSSWDSWRDARERHRQLDEDATKHCDRLAVLCEAATSLAPPNPPRDGLMSIWQSRHGNYYGDSILNSK